MENGKRFDKKNASRSEVVTYRFKLMAENVKSLKEKSGSAELASEEELAKNDQYIRINGESYQAVSLKDTSALCKIGEGNDIKVEAVISRLKNAEAKELAPEVLKKKEERRLQAFLLKQALSSGRKLRDCLGLGEYFEKLVFCLDEVSLGDRNHTENDGEEQGVIRCDLLAVGVVDGKFYPVIIELKSTRSQTALIDQVEKFPEEILDEKTPEVFSSFAELLTLCAGFEGCTLEKEFKKVIVWPRNDNALANTMKKWGEAGVIEVSYTRTAGMDDASVWEFNAS